MQENELPLDTHLISEQADMSPAVAQLDNFPSPKNMKKSKSMDEVTLHDGWIGFFFVFSNMYVYMVHVYGTQNVLILACNMMNKTRICNCTHSSNLEPEKNHSRKGKGGYFNFEKSTDVYIYTTHMYVTYLKIF